MTKSPRVFLAAVVCLLAGFSTFSSAQTFKSLASFDGSNGNSPLFLSLVQGTDGNFYGTTNGGGTQGSGTVFKITSAGTLTTLYSFCSQANCTDGAFPLFGLVLATDGNLYGTTSAGGTTINSCYNNAGCGTVFKISQTGKFTSLHSFTGAGGDSPNGLIQASDGSFYSTTSYGGATVNISCFNSLGCGTVFKVTSAGAVTTIYSFCLQTACPDGDTPNAGVIQATNGMFYGTTLSGGTSSNCAAGCGTVFSVTSAGTLSTLHNFASTPASDGAFPLSSLSQATNGSFYGTTSAGGSSANCSGGCGTIFAINSAGVITQLHSFAGSDGETPSSALIQATNGTFYGTASGGGTNILGTIFGITTSGTLTTLHDFDSTDGATPFGGLLQATNGSFYGTTFAGGTSGDGTVFNLAVGLGPFVESVPGSGKIGTKVIILGNNLKGATSVTFNGTSATFTTVSNSEITTTVPTGATSGKIQVKTATRTLTSNAVFRVK